VAAVVASALPVAAGGVAVAEATGVPVGSAAEGVPQGEGGGESVPPPSVPLPCAEGVTPAVALAAPLAAPPSGPSCFSPPRTRRTAASLDTPFVAASASSCSTARARKRSASPAYAPPPRTQEEAQARLKDTYAGVK
jgi:hypothetical protein